MRYPTAMRPLTFGLAVVTPLAAIAAAPGLENTRAAFATAVGSGDAAAAAAASSFPLHNTAYLQADTLDRASFVEGFSDLKPYAGCLLSKPFAASEQHPGEQVIDCDGSLFFFGKRQGKWRYVGYENVNE